MNIPPPPSLLSQIPSSPDPKSDCKLNLSSNLKPKFNSPSTPILNSVPWPSYDAPSPTHYPHHTTHARSRSHPCQPNNPLSPAAGSSADCRKAAAVAATRCKGHRGSTAYQRHWTSCAGGSEETVTELLQPLFTAAEEIAPTPWPPFPLSQLGRPGLASTTLPPGPRAFRVERKREGEGPITPVLAGLRGKSREEEISAKVGKRWQSRGGGLVWKKERKEEEMRSGRQEGSGDLYSEVLCGAQIVCNDQNLHWK
ncbi:uncharacterized protein LOC115088514 [Rhinatrema bivittatum]|uniref:uncharacterized protein LOC115088514 n=1 Tax=Rhinatrema bivittatum TaxID=194408 RepID=UPI00112A2717|nr:uncharacterized protein LOC115088514 [Rhinatrema bivittatum]